MSATNTPHQRSDEKRTCRAAREQMTPALIELARLHSHLSMPQEAFAAEVQRIADEHAQPCGCELHVQHTSEGPIQIRIKSQKFKVPCEVCRIIECFFHRRTE